MQHSSLFSQYTRQIINNNLHSGNKGNWLQDPSCTRNVTLRRRLAWNWFGCTRKLLPVSALRTKGKIIETGLWWPTSRRTTEFVRVHITLWSGSGWNRTGVPVSNTLTSAKHYFDRQMGKGCTSNAGPILLPSSNFMFRSSDLWSSGTFFWTSCGSV